MIGDGETSVSVQHRCVRMEEHMRSGNDRCHPKLATPCADCYSLVVTSVRIPWRPDQRWSTAVGPVVT